MYLELAGKLQVATGRQNGFDPTIANIKQNAVGNWQ